MEYENLKQEWIKKVSVKTDKRVINESYLSKVTQTCLHTAPKNIQEDANVNYYAAIEGGEFFSNLNEKVKNDKSFVLKLIENGYSSKIYIPNLNEELKKDMDIILALLKKDQAIRNYPEEIIQNKNAVLEILKYENLWNVDVYLKEGKAQSKLFHKLYGKDPEVIKNYIIYHDVCYLTQLETSIDSKKRKLLKEIITQPDFYTELFLHSEKQQSKFSRKNEKYIEIYKNLSPELKENPIIIDKFLQKDNLNINYLPAHLRDNPDFMIEAITKYGCSIRYSGNNVLENEDVVKAYFIKNKEAIKTQDVTPFHYPSSSIAEIALQYCTDINYLSANLFQDHALVKKYLDANPENYPALTSKLASHYHLLNNTEIMSECVRRDHKILDKFSILKDNVVLSKIVLENNPDIRYLATELYFDRKLVIDLLKKKNTNAGYFQTNYTLKMHYREDEEVMKLLIRISPDLITISPKYKRDKTMVQYAINCGLSDIKYIDTCLYNDSEIAKNLIHKNAKNYLNIAYELRNDTSIAMLAIKNDLTLQTVLENSDLLGNKNFYIEAITHKPDLYMQIPDGDIYQQDIEVAYRYIKMLENKDVSTLKLPKVLFDKYNTQDVVELKNLICEEYAQKIADDLDNKLILKKATKERKLKM